MTRDRGRVGDGLDEQLVLVEAPGEEAHVGLTGASDDGAVDLAAPHDGRKALRAAKARHLAQLLVRHAARHHHRLRIGGAHLELAVDVRDAPQLGVEAHALVLLVDEVERIAFGKHALARCGGRYWRY